MPYNANLGPDQQYGVDDGGCCEVCEEHLDTGRCTCARCEDCGENIEGNDEAQTITVEHATTKQPVEIKVCLGCAEKRK
jgi:hypothetical protein